MRSRGSSSSSACRRHEVAADPEAGPLARAFVAYERALRATGALDFDDLVLRALEPSRPTRRCWRAGAARCAHLLVDEVQDVDRAQLRLALLLAAPANRIFLVGDDDQSIYGWRLADVRRILGLRAPCPACAGSTSRSTTAARVRSSNGRSGSSSTTTSGSRRSIRAGPAADGPARPGARRLRRDRSGWRGRSRRGPTTTRRGPSSPGPTASCSRRSPSRCGLGLPVPRAADRAAAGGRRRSTTLLARSAAARTASGTGRRAAAPDAGPRPRRPRGPPPRRSSRRALLGWAAGHPGRRRRSSRRSATAAPASPSCGATTRR